MNKSLKLTLFWLSFLLVGSLLALFFGIGWLFLLLTLRRAMVFVPALERLLRERLLGLPPRPPEPDARVQRFALGLGIVTLLAWVGLTIIAFMQLNFPLLELFSTR